MLQASAFWSGDTVLDSNVANGGGGAVFGLSCPTVSLNWNVVRQNRARFWHSGGLAFVHCITSISNSVFHNNLAGDCGGAIGLYFSPLMLLDSTFRDNAALADGGAIWLIGVLSMVTSSGDVRVINNAAGDRGGGISIATQGSLAIVGQGCLNLHGNSAGKHGGGFSLEFESKVQSEEGDVGCLNVDSNSALEGGGGFVSGDSMLSLTWTPSESDHGFAAAPAGVFFFSPPPLAQVAPVAIGGRIVT